MTMKDKTKLIGSELLKALEAEASFELKQTRQLVEEACMKDISAYWTGSGLGEITRSSISTLVTPAIAGGQWGFNSLVSRLQNLNVADSQLDEIANEILELASPHAKLLNYSRFRSGAVQAYVTQCKETSFDAELLGITESKSRGYKSNLEKILSSKISSLDSLYSWSTQVSDLMEQLSIEQDRQHASSEEAAGKGRKGSVSTKSISSYSKHWLSFTEEKLSSEVGGTWKGDPEESTAERAKYLISYETLSWSQMKKSLLESKSTRRSFSNNQRSQPKKTNSISDKLITDNHDLGGRKLTISYNVPGVDSDLIKPAINSLKGHMIINPKSTHASVNMKSDSSYLSIDLENPRKSDLETVEILLNSHI
jgi:hypothetical protein